MSAWRDLIGTVNTVFKIGLNKASLDAGALTAPRTYALPNVAGTLALTSQLGAAISVSQIDLGVNPVRSGRAVLTDAALLATDGLIVTLAPGPYPGKGTLADEAEMSGPITFSAVCSAGSALLYWSSAFAQRGNVKVNYMRSLSLLTPGDAQILALFATGQLGAWFDPSDAAARYTDPAAVTLAGIGQAVGNLLDKKTRVAPVVLYGPDRPPLAAVGTTPPTVDNGSTFLGSPAIAVTFPVLASGGFAVSRAQGAGLAAQVTIAVGVVLRARFKVALSRALAASESVRLYATGAAATTEYALGSTSPANQWIDTPLMGEPIKLTGSRYPVVYALSALASPVTVYVSEYYAEKVEGAHLAQATAAARPLVSASGSLLFDGVDDSLSSQSGGGGTAGFFLCQAIKPMGGAGTVRTVWSDTGTNSGYKVQLNAANQLELSAGNSTAFTAVATAAAADIGTTVLLTLWDDGVNLNAQIGSSAVASIARPVVTAGTVGFTMGKDNGAATGFFTGNLYAAVYRQITPDAAQLAQIQTYIMSRAGL